MALVNKGHHLLHGGALAEAVNCFDAAISVCGGDHDQKLWRQLAMAYGKKSACLCLDEGHGSHGGGRRELPAAVR